MYVCMYVYIYIYIYIETTPHGDMPVHGRVPTHELDRFSTWQLQPAMSTRAQETSMCKTLTPPLQQASTRAPQTWGYIYIYINNNIVMTI